MARASKEYKHKSRNKRTRRTSASAIVTVISNLFTFGISAATSTTVVLASSAASAASDYTVKPFNALVQRTTRRYFAPQIAYPDYGLSWSLGGGRRRSTTVVDDSIPRRKSLDSRSLASNIQGSVPFSARRYRYCEERIR